MTNGQLKEKYMHWAERVGYAASNDDLESAQMLLSYDDKRTEETFSGVSVYTVAIHTNHVHLFLYTVRTTWRLDERGDAGNVIDERYRMILAF